MSLVGVAALSALAPAQTIPMLARMNGAQETPPLLVPGSGLAFIAVDVAALTVTYRELYQNLTSAENNAHIHGFSGVGFPAPIVHVQALGTLKCGVWSGLTPAQLGQVLAGQSYVNVHTVLNGGGELRGQINLAPDQATFCYGDNSGTACPCNNPSAIGDNEGCLHQPGMGGRLVGYSGTGTAGVSIANDNLVLHALRLPASTFVLFFQGTAPMAGGNGIMFGSGLLCLNGTLTRMNVKATCNGQAGLPEPGDFPISVQGGVVPGAYFYQGWFRTFPAFCSAIPANYNMTNGVAVTWVP
jgi:CHRD domain